jgi:hypothetical protein
MNADKKMRAMTLARRIGVALICLLPLLTIAHPTPSGAWTLNHSAFISPDEFSYLLTAQNIAAGHGIRLPGLDNFYPPGFPFLLALWGKRFGFSLISMHLAVTTLQIAANILIVRIVAKIWDILTASRGSPWLPVTILLLYATNWNVLENIMSIFSEGAFTLAVFAWLALGIHRPGWLESIPWTLVMALLAVAATAMRSAGIVCVALTLAWPWMAWWWEVGDLRSVTHHYWLKALRASALVLAIVIAWYVGIALASPEKSILQTNGHNSYTMQLLHGITHGTFLSDVIAHLDDWSQSFVPPPREAWRAVPLGWAGKIFLALALLGFIPRWWTRSRAALRFVDWFVLLYVGLYAIWPFDFARFWIPILPLMLTYAALGLSALRRTRLRISRPAIAAAALMLALNLWEIHGKLFAYATRIDYVTDCLAGTRAAITSVGGTPRDTMLSNETFTFSYHTGLAQIDLPWPDPPDQAAKIITDRAQQEGVVFVGSYFTPALYRPLIDAVIQRGVSVQKIDDADMVQVWAVRAAAPAK